MTVISLSFIIFHLSFSRVAAQTQVEYWIDQDPGLGKAVKATATIDGEGNFDLDVPTGSLSAGHHLLGVRAYNTADASTSFGPTMLQHFYVPRSDGSENITRVEYFWDEDPGMGHGTPVAITPGQEVSLNNLELSTATLAPGTHLLGIRAYGNEGWGPAILQTVVVPRRGSDQFISYVEYFWDEDPGMGHGTPIAITPGTEVDIENLEFSTAGLSSGLHYLGVRSFGSDGWSPTVSMETYVPLRPQDAVVSNAEYFWNNDPGFGQGTPVSITSGKEVTLDALGIPTTDIHGDALFFIRYRGPFGWSPTLCYKILVDAEGNYTLNAQAETSIDTRNYQSLPDAFSDFADRGVGNNITLTLPTTNTEYALDATTDEVLAQVEAISQSIDRVSTLREAKTIGFKAAASSGNTLSVTTTDEGLPAVLDLFSRTWLENVTLTINGTAYDFSSFAQAPRYEELCADEETLPVSIAAPASNLSVSFTAQPHEDTVLSGFPAEATAALPVMTLSNSGAKTDSLAWHVALTDANGTEMAAYTYYIYVRPRVGSQTFAGMLPADGSSLDPGTVTLRWNAVPAAEGYRLTVTDTTGDEPAVVLDAISVETTTYPLTIETGHHYQWQVVAVGPCDELQSPAMTLETRLLPDLAVTAIALPEAAEAGNTITVTATVKNLGEGATTEGSWIDRLYYVIDSEDFAQAVQAAELTHSGNLVANATYDVTFQLKVPQNDNGSLRVFVETDAKAKVMETDDTNNRTLSAAATLKPFYMNAEDLAALRLLYTNYGGEAWNGTSWNTASTLITPDNWSGVTFDTEGHVTAINLQGRGLSGSLSVPYAAMLSQLKTLNLSRNALTGDPSVLVNTTTMPALTTLDLSYNQIDELSASLPTTITSLNMGYQHRRYGNNSVLPGLDGLGTRVLNIGNGMTVSLPQPMLYSHSAQTFSTHPQLYVYSTNLGTRYGTLNWSNTYETYSYAAGSWQQTQEQDADVLLMPADGTTLHHSVLPAQMHFTRGDANLTGLVDVNDVQRTLNYVIDQNNSSTFGFWAANTFTEDETSLVINIQDIVSTVNIVLANEGIEEVAARRLRTPRHDSLQVANNTLHVDGRVLTLTATQEIAALDVELAGVKASQLRLLLSSRQWQMQTRDTQRGVRLMLFSPTGQSLTEGDTQLLRLSADGVWPVAADASDPEALHVAVGVSEGTTTGIDLLQWDGDGSVYDLQGRKVSTDSTTPLRKGIYIQNGKKVKK